MENLYEKNGLIFWSEQEIKLRNMFQEYFVTNITNKLKSMNRGFEIIQCEAPVLMPQAMMNANYTTDDVLMVDTPDELVLRPETTKGSYLYVQHLLNPHNERKMKLPICVWQHGKSFRNEQEQPTKYMRLKEFYQLEFQVVYSKSTTNDYHGKLVEYVNELVSSIIGVSYIIESDRTPSYSENTMDINIKKNDMEVCSISKRNDFEDCYVAEIALGTDRLIYNFNNK